MAYLYLYVHRTHIATANTHTHTLHVIIIYGMGALLYYYLSAAYGKNVRNGTNLLNIKYE